MTRSKNHIRMYHYGLALFSSGIGWRVAAVREARIRRTPREKPRDRSQRFNRCAAVRWLIGALLYFGGGVGVAVLDFPGLIVLSVCAADLIIKAIRNARIRRQLAELSARHTVMFGSVSESSVAEAGRVAGFAARGTIGAGIGLAVGLVRDAYDNARAEKEMSSAQRAIHQEIRRLAATKSDYRLTFALFSWLAIVAAIRWGVEVASQ